MSKNKLIQSVKARLGEVGHGIEFDVIIDGVRREIHGGMYRSWRRETARMFPEKSLSVFLPTLKMN
jgi:hypothetical protein